MKKNRGMKIYKQKKRRRKGNSGQIMSILGTCAVVFGVGIFGYYVVAVPIIDLINGNKEEKKPSSSVSVTTDESIVTTNKKIFDDITVTRVPVDNDNTGTLATTTVPDVTTSVTTVTSVSSETTTVTTTTTTTPEVTTTQATTVTTSAPSPVINLINEGGCYYLTESDVQDIDVMKEKLASLEGYSSVVLPLKLTGGRLNYDSAVRTARLSGVISCYVTIDEMVQAVKESGMEPIAEISTIADNIYPLTYKKSAYQFDDGYTGEWLDNAYEAGGKPWLSPFADDAISYLTDIVDELTTAGVGSIICTDTYFPPFREKDLGYIGEIVQSEDRYKGLTDLINTLDDKAKSNGGRVMLGVSANEVINSTAEVFKPSEFGNMHVVVNISMNDFSDKNMNEVMGMIENKTEKMQIVPCIVSAGTSDVDANIKALEKLGYDYYMVK